LARQIGVLHERLTPVGALNTGTGPVVGEPAPLLRATAMDGTLLEIGTRRPSGRRLLMLFVSRGCPICKVLIPVAQDMARLETLDLLFIGDSNAPEQTALIADFQISPADFINGSTIGMTYQVDKLPHAVLIDENGLLISRGLVNSREHLESLVVAQETGFASVQDFLRRRQHA
jgi:methylamine dehydrogenase accessory protein MauD